MIVRQHTVEAVDDVCLLDGTLDADDGVRKLRQVKRVCKWEKEKELTIDGSTDETSEDTHAQETDVHKKHMQTSGKREKTKHSHHGDCSTSRLLLGTGDSS